VSLAPSRRGRNGPCPSPGKTLNQAGLRLVMLKRSVTDREQSGKVVEQTPQAGVQAPKNAQVLVYMGAYPG
jgi:beta-lactam-binding protein with PASTA domain